MDDVSFGIAFLAGILSFLSPCVLPLVPGYISFLSGVSLEELSKGESSRRVLHKAGILSIFFVIGFSIVFVALGASASFIGRLLAAHMDVLVKVAGAIIVILGLQLLGVLKLSWLYKERRFSLTKRSPGIFTALLIGIAFAFGWTPCVGPILAGILALAATQDTMVRGMTLLAVYSAGLGIPFIITGFAVGAFMRFFEKYKKFIRWGEIVAGVLLVILGVLIFTNKLSVIMQYLPAATFEFSR